MISYLTLYICQCPQNCTTQKVNTNVNCGFQLIINQNGTNELIYKTEIRVTDVENKLMVTKGGKKGDKLGDWD